ncbi:MAG: hypothetical protein KKE62_01890 [Proteobacteria bacterium]|nr:hypothetical protein [Pseudomonadota bacterium]MBU1387110.1 hypothetical protein [Pseudomonadota bacterium]MBU1541573.1 hypothetical protein [Pseudomonadota bacterium]MBU2429519.1 hypothetical protein [Pseudomonadota bacterium]MBU2482757.1 hypothetical protein [Pseudomonadota bacterium]
MSNLIRAARDLVHELLQGVNLKQERYVRQILRQGYQQYGLRIPFGHTKSGYKAWRKACNEATRKPTAKKIDPKQMELF